MQVASGQLQPMMSAARAHAHDRIGYWVQRAENWDQANPATAATAARGKAPKARRNRAGAQIQRSDRGR